MSAYDTKKINRVKILNALKTIKHFYSPPLKISPNSPQTLLSPNSPLLKLSTPQTSKSTFLVEKLKGWQGHLGLTTVPLKTIVFILKIDFFPLWFLYKVISRSLLQKQLRKFLKLNNVHIVDPIRIPLWILHILLKIQCYSRNYYVIPF